jgi:hypothetical protein
MIARAMQRSQTADRNFKGTDPFVNRRFHLTNAN